MLSFANQTIVYKNNFHHSNAWFKWMTSTSLPSIKPKLPACHPLRAAIGIGSKANHHVRPKSNPEKICFDMASWYQKLDRIRHSICPHNAFRFSTSPIACCLYRRCIKWTKHKQNFMTEFFTSGSLCREGIRTSCVRPRKRYYHGCGPSSLLCDRRCDAIAARSGASPGLLSKSETAYHAGAAAKPALR